MPITSVVEHAESLTVAVLAEYSVPLERVWDAHVDPRQLEHFWCPPTHTATITRHDAAPGGLSAFSMADPDGNISHVYWHWQSVEPGSSFDVLEGFALADGSPDTDAPTVRLVFAFESTPHGSRVSTTAHFDTADDFTRMLEMGMVDGLAQSIGQLDQVLGDGRSFAADQSTMTQILSDTQVRISRVITSTPELVWRAHHEKALLQQWLLGPAGWSMPVCEMAASAGDPYRYIWDNGKHRFGFEGTLLEALPPLRSVVTERMISPPHTSTLNEMTLTTVTGGTLVCLLITYPNTGVRNALLATGMTDGMETSYRRLGNLVRTIG